MNLENFFHGGVSYLNDDLSDGRYNQCVLDFFSRSVDYKRKFSYGFGGYLDRGYEHSGDASLPDMQESYTMTPGRNEPVPPELELIYESLFKGLCRMSDQVLATILESEYIKPSGLKPDDFEYSMLINYFYPYSTTEIESNREFRMGEHIDEGLFTAMPHGAVYDFEALENGTWFTPQEVVGSPLVFPGKLIQFLSGGKIQALKHRVRLSERKTARVSYPFAALPKGHVNLAPLGRFDQALTGRAYMENYLSDHINKNMEY